MIRRETFASAGGFDRFAQPCEDWDLWLRLEQAKARFVTCPEPLLIYRIHSSNTSSRDAYRMYHAEMRAYDRLVAKRFHPAFRSTHRLYMQSKFLLGVAVVERQQGRPHLNALMGSIAIFPFGRWMRYKIAAHVLLKRAHVLH
jgi:GT2 family glycosyltransferase